MLSACSIVFAPDFLLLHRHTYKGGINVTNTVPGGLTHLDNDLIKTILVSDTRRRA